MAPRYAIGTLVLLTAVVAVAGREARAGMPRGVGAVQVPPGASGSTARPGAAPPSIDFRCRTGPVPTGPGQRPVLERAVTVGPRGATHRITRYLSGAPDDAASTLPPASLSRLHAAARAALAAAPIAPEPSVPDGLSCTIDVTAAGTTTHFVASPPSRNPVLAALLAELQPLLPR